MFERGIWTYQQNEAQKRSNFQTAQIYAHNPFHTNENDSNKINDFIEIDRRVPEPLNNAVVVPPDISSVPKNTVQPAAGGDPAGDPAELVSQPALPP